MARLVNALFLDPNDANSAVNALLKHGYAREEISVVMSDALNDRLSDPGAVADRVAGRLEAVLDGGLRAGRQLPLLPRRRLLRRLVNESLPAASAPGRLRR